MIVGRIKEFMDKMGISVAAFERSIGMSNASFGKSLKNKGAIGTDKLENILSVYPNLNPAWLLTGEGSMLKSTTPSTDGAASSPSIEHLQTEKSEKISSTEDTTAFLAYMREQATAHTKAIEKKEAEIKEKEALHREELKEKDTIIEQKNQQIADLRCQVTRLEGENRHLIEELDRIKMERTQQSSTPQSGDTSTSQQGDTSSQPDCAPRSHTA